MEIKAKLNKKKLEGVFREIIDKKFKILEDELNKVGEEIYNLYEELKTIKIKLAGGFDLS